MEFDQLRNFLEVAAEQNFARAAEEIGLSQPAVRRSIARLEEELGQPVFERQTRRVTLADAGRLLEPRARQILALIDDAKAEITDDGRTGRIRLAAIPTIAPYCLPELFVGSRNRRRRRWSRCREETTERLLRRCHDGEIDLAIVALPGDGEAPAGRAAVRGGTAAGDAPGARAGDEEAGHLGRCRAVSVRVA